MLYVRLLKERKEPNGIVVSASEDVAVFNEVELDKCIAEAKAKWRRLRELRKMATSHSHNVRIEHLQALGVPFQVKRYLEKKA